MNDHRVPSAFGDILVVDPKQSQSFTSHVMVAGYHNQLAPALVFDVVTKFVKLTFEVAVWRVEHIPRDDDAVNVWKDISNVTLTVTSSLSFLATYQMQVA